MNVIDKNMTVMKFFLSFQDPVSHYLDRILKIIKGSSESNSSLSEGTPELQETARC